MLYCNLQHTLNLLFLQEYLCSPIELQCRAAAFARQGEIYNELPNSSSMSHVGSSIATWGSTQDTQFGTAAQQATAAAAIMLSQLLDEDHAAPQGPAEEAAISLKPTTDTATEHTAHDAVLQQPDVAAVSAEVLTAAAAVACAAAPAATVAGDLAAPEHEDQDTAQLQQADTAVPTAHSQGNKADAAAEQAQDMADFPATEVQYAEPTELQCCDGQQQRSAAQTTELPHTEVQHDVKAVDVQVKRHVQQTAWRQKKAPQQEHTASAQPISKPTCAQQQQQQPAKEQREVTRQSTATNGAEQAAPADTPSAAAAVPLASNDKAEQQAGPKPKAVSHPEVAVASPAQNLQLDLTYRDHACDGDISNAVAAEESPNRLQLGLDTQLPSPAPGTAVKQPVGVLGWWGGAWSAPQGLPDAAADLVLYGNASQTDSQQLPDFTCHVAEQQDGLLDGTEVTPSGVRPPRGLSATPLPRPGSQTISNKVGLLL